MTIETADLVADWQVERSRVCASCRALFPLNTPLPTEGEGGDLIERAPHAWCDSCTARYWRARPVLAQRLLCRSHFPFEAAK